MYHSALPVISSVAAAGHSGAFTQGTRWPTPDIGHTRLSLLDTMPDAIVVVDAAGRNCRRGNDRDEARWWGVAGAGALCYAFLEDRQQNRAGEQHRPDEGIDRDRVDVVANTMRKLALPLEAPTWPVRATCHVMRLRDQRRVNVGARARDVIAAALDREQPADLDAGVRVLREALRDLRPGEIRAQWPAATSEDTEN